MEIEIEDDIIWYPGQSIAIYMINDNKPRYYSIASSPLQDKKYKVIQIIFTIIGKCSSWLSSLKNGDIINFELSELNNFTFDKNIKYMIAIGSGISPFIGFLRHMYYLNLKKYNSDECDTNFDDKMKQLFNYKNKLLEEVLLLQSAFSMIDLMFRQEIENAEIIKKSCCCCKPKLQDPEEINPFLKKLIDQKFVKKFNDLNTDSSNIFRNLFKVFEVIFQKNNENNKNKD